jgi:hypothetical protein
MTEMLLLADIPGRPRFDIGGREVYLRLPIRVRDAYLEQIENWRAKENSRK